MPNILWIQSLKYKDMLLSPVLHDSKHNIF